MSETSEATTESAVTRQRQRAEEMRTEVEDALGVALPPDLWGPPTQVDGPSMFGMSFPIGYLVTCLRCGATVSLIPGQPNPLIIHDEWHAR